jgi:predicted methyltransferase
MKLNTSSRFTRAIVVVILGLNFSAKVAAGTHYDPVLEHSSRATENRIRDQARKPGQVMSLAQIRKGDKVLDLNAGKGYYTELFSIAVGEKGKVYSHKSRVTQEQLAQFPYSNVEKVDNLYLEGFEGKVDVALTALNYHDLANPKNKINRQRYLSNVKKHLVPGGKLVIIDHNAAPGKGMNNTSDLHRIERSVVIEEVLEADFVLVGISHILSNASDDHSLKVHETAIRGKTDRFVLVFRHK